MSDRYQRAQSLQVRSEYEIPMLVSNAKEIISLLQQEYPEQSSRATTWSIAHSSTKAPARARGARTPASWPGPKVLSKCVTAYFVRWPSSSRPSITAPTSPFASPFSLTNNVPAAFTWTSAYQTVRFFAASNSTALNSAFDFALYIF